MQTTLWVWEEDPKRISADFLEAYNPKRASTDVLEACSTIQEECKRSSKNRLRPVLRWINRERVEPRLWERLKQNLSGISTDMQRWGNASCAVWDYRIRIILKRRVKEREKGHSGRKKPPIALGRVVSKKLEELANANGATVPGIEMTYIQQKAS